LRLRSQRKPKLPSEKLPLSMIFLVNSFKSFKLIKTI
jgi:hypothetical protein